MSNTLETLKSFFTRPVAMMLLSLIAAGVLVGFFVARRRQWLETNAVAQLQILGSLELNFQDGNLDKNYADFATLQAGGYFQKTTARARLITGYDLASFEVHNIDFPITTNTNYQDASFTIVAVPRNGTLHLRTFAITDDQLVRVRTAEPDTYCPCSWEPLR